MWKSKELKVEGLLQKRKMLCEINFSNITNQSLNFYIIFLWNELTIKPILILRQNKQIPRPHFKSRIYNLKKVSVCSSVDFLTV